MRVIRKSLSRKIVLAVAASLVLLLGLTNWLTARDHRKTVEQLENITNHSLGRFVEKALEVSMVEGKMEDLKKILKSAGKTTGVRFLRIVSDDGVIQYSADPEEARRPLPSEPLKRLLREAAQSGRLIENRMQGSVAIAIPLPNDATCRSCHASDGDSLGAIMLGFDFSQFDQRLAEARIRRLVVSGLSVLLVVVVVSLCLRVLVLRPLFRVVESAREMAQGNLTHAAEVEGEDEMATLARHLNTLRAHLRDSIQESSEVSDALAQAVEELDRSSESLVTIAMEQSSGAAEQASAVQEATTTSEEIAATSNEIATNVESVETVAEETYNAGIRGREAVRTAVEAMGLVKGKVQAIADSMLDLGRRSQKIGGIVDIIDEISEETHLLALNAAIEAAGAGEYGKRFSVVAAEIRRLAERTVEATTQIKGLIEGIQDSTNETLLVTEKGAGMVVAGAERVDHLGENLEGILALVRQTKESTREITVATQQQATAGEQMVLTITDINDVAVQVNRSAEQVEKAVIRLKELARNLKGLVEENRSFRRFNV